MRSRKYSGSTHKPQDPASTRVRVVPDVDDGLTSDPNLDAMAQLLDLIVLRFDRREIEIGDTGDSLRRLRRLSVSTTVAREWANRVTFTVFGYDNDPRDIWEIPACRTFFGRLADEWDGWLHFLEKEGASIPIFLSLLLDLAVLRKHDGKTVIKLNDVNQVGHLRSQLLGRMNQLYERLNLGETARKDMADQVIAAFYRAFPAEGAGADHAPRYVN